MQCPHCLQHFHTAEEQASIVVSNDADATWLVRAKTCPACHRAIIHLEAQKKPVTSRFREPSKTWMVYPKAVARTPLPPEVPAQFVEDYREACLVLPDSEKASAALSRRCLQNLLVNHAKVKKKDLNDQIDEVLPTLPSYITDELHTVRVVGNFAVHPIKSKSTGEIVEVEPGEAEGLLNVLESLFDFYFVQPAKAKERKAALNKKIVDAGKPPLK